MGILQTAAADIEAAWSKVETVVEADAQVIATAAKAFFTKVEPSLLASLVTIATQAAADAIALVEGAMNPAQLATTLLGQAEAAGSALWNLLEPQAKSAAVTAIVAIGQLNAAAP